MIVVVIAAFVVAFILYLLTSSSSNTSSNQQKRETSTDGESTQQGSSWKSVPLQRRSSTFQPIPDKYQTIEQLQDGLRQAGLESSNLIVAIDYTRSNTWTGKWSFGGRCLHDISPVTMNPYQRALQILCSTLEAFDDDHLIPAFGFGDISTRDKGVFSFLPDNEPCVGLTSVLNRYSEITPSIVLSGPTSFAPILKEAIRIVQKQQGYHILIIIADGQVDKVTETVDAIVECSKYPISIILIGVGDGPWDKMEEFDDELPQRAFDNFQFVNFNDLQTKWKGNEINFAMNALMEIPDQYLAIKRLKLL